MMEYDDGAYLVIIGTEEPDLDSQAKLDGAEESIKQEYLDKEDSFADLIEKVEKHGVKVDIKLEPEEDNSDLCEVSQIKTEFLEDEENDDYVPENETYTSDEEQEYTTKSARKKQASKRTNSEEKEKKIYKKRVRKYKSFVEELRKESKELKYDTELLIDRLTEIMRDVKPPALPQDYFVMHNVDYACIKCDFVSKTIPAAGRHYRYKHMNVRYLVCFACGDTFPCTTTLYKHEKRCNAPDAHIVLKARSAFLGRKGRQRPYLNIRPPRPKIRVYKRYSCSMCSAVFHSKAALGSHEHLHRGERPHRCHVCPAAYTSPIGLARHLSTHSDARFICDTCKRVFKQKVTLVAHMNTHNPLRKYPCTECDRRFSQKCAMLHHVNRVHRNLPLPCACQICPKRYPRMSLLKTHMNKAHNMALMTRKMFMKKFPKLSELQVQQAKVVLTSEAPALADYYCWEMEDDAMSENSSQDSSIM